MYDDGEGDLETLVKNAVDSTKEVNSGQIDVNFFLLQKLMQFPHHQLFPVLDLCRMMALNASTQGRLSAMAGDLSSKRPGEFWRPWLSFSGVGT